MDSCAKQQSWTSYWMENMEALGLPTSHSIYGTQTLLTGTIAALANVSRTFGPSVTVGELVVAGSVAEGLTVVAGISGAWYLGAAVGSAAVASGRHMACGTRMIDVFAYASRNRMLTPAIQYQLIAHPEIYDATKRHRSIYGHMARAA